MTSPKKLSLLPIYSLLVNTISLAVYRKKFPLPIQLLVPFIGAMIGAVPSPAQTFSFFSLHIQDHLHSSKLMSYGGLAQKDHVLQKLAEPYCHWQRLFPSMGTYLKLILVAPCDSTKVSFSLNNIHEKIDNLLNEIETKLSLFQEESEVSRLNREGTLTQPSKHLSYLINQAQYHGERTRGYFDITILPVLKWYQRTPRSLPAETKQKELEVLRTLIGYKKISLAEKQIRLPKGGGITLDGIAKGYAVDQTTKLLNSFGYRNYLIDFSGNLKFKGVRSDFDPWKIGLELHKGLAKSHRQLDLRNTSISTSSTLFQKLSGLDGSHIFDPNLLTPTRRHFSVSVSGPSAMVCDLLSTAILNLTEIEARDLLDKNYPKYRIIEFDGEIF
jgi:thiamine biosynthesis lipoprotein